MAGYTPPPSVCKDALKKEECVMLRKLGKCLSNHEELFTNCKATCGFCSKLHITCYWLLVIGFITWSSPACVDSDTTNCPAWAAQGGCITQASTRAKCPFSCKYCGDCGDNSPACAAYALQGRCTEKDILTNCPASCGICGKFNISRSITGGYHITLLRVFRHCGHGGWLCSAGSKGGVWS